MYVYHQEKQDKYVTLVRGKNVDEALAILKYTPRGLLQILEKVLNSANCKC